MLDTVPFDAFLLVPPTECVPIHYKIDQPKMTDGQNFTVLTNARSEDQSPSDNHDHGHQDLRAISVSAADHGENNYGIEPEEIKQHQL